MELCANLGRARTTRYSGAGENNQEKTDIVVVTIEDLEMRMVA